MSRTFAVLDAPSNLGLRPPAPGVVPGVYKLAGALRDLGIVPAIDAVDVGVATAPRYQLHADVLPPGTGVVAVARAGVSTKPGVQPRLVSEVGGIWTLPVRLVEAAIAPWRVN